MENLTENNKLIAEFMGLNLFKNSNEFERIYGSDTEYTASKSSYEDLYIINEGQPNWRTITDLEYNSSWDWLMPVVEKIQRLTIENALYDSYLKGIELTINLNKSFSEVSITKIYNRCVEFIKWYNQQK